MSFKVNIYIYTSMKGLKQKKGVAGWLVDFEKKNGEIVTRPHKGPGIVVVEGTETKATLTALEEALKILTKSCENRLFANKSGIFDPLKNGWLDMWKERNFQNSKGKPVKNSEEWKKIAELLENHTVEIEKDLGSYKLFLPSEVEKNVDFANNIQKGGE